MRSETAWIHGIRFPVHSVNTLVIGSGAAALKAALTLHEKGQHDLAIVTEKWGGGASNNAGSDKQTYYKLSLGGELLDSPMDMAKDLFAGRCMHGDIALCEAQHSAQVFHDLVHFGVPFPHDRYGGFPGYRTDHDPRSRATSAGPLTSHYMFEALAARVIAKNIPVFDLHPVIALFKGQDRPDAGIIGAAALDLNALEEDNYGLVLCNAVNVVLGTGGPGGMYEMSVYPEDQTGSIGLALEIGAVAHNLTESQFGLASLHFRWNVSGSYQQVMPRYLSTDTAGGNTRDFLAAWFPDMESMTGAIFRKGYQWPFDPRKIAHYGSSVIDLAVHQETALRGRRVYLDFRRNPEWGTGALAFDLSRIPVEAREYLEKSGAMQPTPIERLAALNPRAIELYRGRGIDLEKEPLEIAVCAQHNNGGLRANHWWESNIRHLFPVGEVNGTHGVYRPGGAALNAGQVGGLRAAMFIARKYGAAPPEIPMYVPRIGPQVKGILDRISAWLHSAGRQNPALVLMRLPEIRRRMSRCGAHIRNPEEIPGAVDAAWRTFREIDSLGSVGRRNELPAAFKTRELALAHAVYLEAVGEYIGQGGKSRGSYLVPSADGELTSGGTENNLRYSLTEEDAFVNGHILELALDSEARIHKEWVPVRPIPAVDHWFENVWRDYLNGRCYEESEE